jgi:tyrosine-protein kinase Etk/Wzc
MTTENMPQSENKVNSDQNEIENEDEEISLLDLLLVVVENLRLLVLGPLAVGLAALGISFMIPPTYTAKTQFLPPQQQQSSASALVQALGVGAIGGLSAGLGIKNPADQYIAFLKSQSIQDAMVDRFDLLKRYDTKFRVEARKELLENTKISAGKDGIIALELDDKDPKVAADMANAYVDELRRMMNRLALTEAQLRRSFFEKKLKEAKENLSAAEESLRGTGVSGGVLKTSPGAAVEVVARLKAGITVQEIKVASMRGYLADTSPEFVQAMKELSVLKAQLTNAEKSDTATGDGLYVSRYREFKYQETLYELFAKQYELARVDESREGAAVQVVDSAQPPEKKSRPKKALIAIIASLASGFVFLLFVFLRKAYLSALSDRENADKVSRLSSSWLKVFGR